MTFRPPRSVVFGSGRRRWKLTVSVLRLADYESRHREHFPGPRSKLSRAFWCSCCRVIWLRADRMSLPSAPQDFLHELDHAYVDWRGEHYEGS